MRRKFDDEFKQNVLRKIFDGQSVRSVAREFGLNQNMVHTWKRNFLKNNSSTPEGQELGEAVALKKRIRELEMENEILKKAALIFGRGS